MTYCVGLRLKRGLVFMSDTRTNAGVDHVGTFRKMFHWETPGERVVTIMTAGNLATTQAVVSMVNERMLSPAERTYPSILDAPSMYQVAKIVGDYLRDVISQHKDPEGAQAEAQFSASIIVGGQIKGGEPRLFHIYPEGNFVEACEETPFFQIGETKYGKPILVRAFEDDMSFEDAVKIIMLSFDSTLKTNISVGLPLDLHIYKTGAHQVGYTHRIHHDDPYFQSLSSGWSDALKDAIQNMPAFTMDDDLGK